MIEQQQWSTLAHVVSVGIEEVEEFFTAKMDGITFKATPMPVMSAGSRPSCFAITARCAGVIVQLMMT
jgi:hypothetical protein